MKTARLIADFSRARQEADTWRVEVAKISWPHPAYPETTWTLVARLPANATPEEIHAARRAVLDDPRFFFVCAQCRQRQPCGWRHAERLCQGCSGVLY